MWDQVPGTSCPRRDHVLGGSFPQGMLADDSWLGNLVLELPQIINTGEPLTALSADMGFLRVDGSVYVLDSYVDV